MKSRQRGEGGGTNRSNDVRATWPQHRWSASLLACCWSWICTSPATGSGHRSGPGWPYSGSPWSRSRCSDKGYAKSDVLLGNTLELWKKEKEWQGRRQTGNSRVNCGSAARGRAVYYYTHNIHTFCKTKIDEGDFILCFTLVRILRNKCVW